jgi:Domain of Unknown Function with PDB structure (DUF3857)
MKKNILIIFLFFFNFITNAQKLELGKVSVQELSEKQHPIDSNAVAAVLFNKAKTVFKYLKDGFYMEHEYSYRIKIYKKDGFFWATKKVNNYIAYKSINKDYLTFTDCVTYNLVDGKIEKTKLKSEGSFDSNINEYYNQSTITMPNVKVGSVIEFKYVIRSEYFTRFPDFDFQQTIPVNYAEYKTEIPEFFIYKQITKGLNKIKTEEKLGFGYQNFSDKNNQGIAMDYKQINTTHSQENIPALKYEEFVDNIENYRSSINYELELTRFPEALVKKYSETWENVAKNIYEDKRFGNEIKEYQYFLNTLDIILKDKPDLLDRLSTIFKYVQTKMNWNGQHSIYSEKGVAKAFLEETGNAAQINFILISMLNRVGINANPVLISTKQNGIHIYPNRTGFDFVIAAAEIDGKTFLLDATDKFSTIKNLPIRDLNWTGRLIRQNGTSEEINLAPDFPSQETNHLKVKIENGGMISGKARIFKSEYYALNFRQSYADSNEESYIEKLQNDLNKIQISNYKIENKKTDFSKPIIETFNFVSNNNVEIINNKIYFSPLLIFVNNNNPFKQEIRNCPIDFEFLKEKNFNITIEIPEGYEIETLPKSINISSGENVLNFKFQIENSENKIQLLINFNSNKTIVSRDFYDIIKDFYKQMIEKQNEKIVLVKK